MSEAWLKFKLRPSSHPEFLLSDLFLSFAVALLAIAGKLSEAGRLKLIQDLLGAGYCWSRYRFWMLLICGTLQCTCRTRSVFDTSHLLLAWAVLRLPSSSTHLVVHLRKTVRTIEIEIPISRRLFMIFQLLTVSTTYALYKELFAPGFQYVS